jgi:hypothetical protein
MSERALRNAQREVRITRYDSQAPHTTIDDRKTPTSAESPIAEEVMRAVASSI